jgi:DNA repair protein RadC
MLEGSTSDEPQKCNGGASKLLDVELLLLLFAVGTRSCDVSRFVCSVMELLVMLLVVSTFSLAALVPRDTVEVVAVGGSHRLRFPTDTGEPTRIY